MPVKLAPQRKTGSVRHEPSKQPVREDLVLARDVLDKKILALDIADRKFLKEAARRKIGNYYTCRVHDYGTQRDVTMFYEVLEYEYRVGQYVLRELYVDSTGMASDRLRVFKSLRGLSPCSRSIYRQNRDHVIDALCFCKQLLMHMRQQARLALRETP